MTTVEHKTREKRRTTDYE